MIPGLGGMDPRTMARMMDQMGIKTEELPAKRVIIEQEGSQIIIEEPQVTKVSMKGSASFQISGKISEKTAISSDDIKMVCDSAKVDEAAARRALEECKGDIAEAILRLQQEKA